MWRLAFASDWFAYFIWRYLMDSKRDHARHVSNGLCGSGRAAMVEKFSSDAPARRLGLGGYFWVRTYPGHGTDAVDWGLEDPDNVK